MNHWLQPMNHWYRQPMNHSLKQLIIGWLQPTNEALVATNGSSVASNGSAPNESLVVANEPLVAPANESLAEAMNHSLVETNESFVATNESLGATNESLVATGRNALGMYEFIVLHMVSRRCSGKGNCQNRKGKGQNRCQSGGSRWWSKRTRAAEERFDQGHQQRRDCIPYRVAARSFVVGQRGEDEVSRAERDRQAIDCTHGRSHDSRSFGGPHSCAKEDQKHLGVASGCDEPWAGK